MHVYDAHVLNMQVLTYCVNGPLYDKNDVFTVLRSYFLSHQRIGVLPKIECYMFQKEKQEKTSHNYSRAQAWIQKFIKRGGGVEKENFERKMFVSTRIIACTHKN